jgi:hypothetical protein
MKKFIIINGLNATIVERESLEDARNTAVNICDHRPQQGNYSVEKF